MGVNALDSCLNTAFATVSNPSNTAINQHLLSISAPCPKGQFTCQDSLCVVDEEGQVLNTHCRILTLWPDHSIRFVHIRCAVSLGPDSESNLYLQRYSSTEIIPSAIQHSSTNRLDISIPCADLNDIQTITVVPEGIMLGETMLRTQVSGRVHGTQQSIEPTSVVSWSFHEMLGQQAPLAVELCIVRHAQAGEVSLNIEETVTINTMTGAMDMTLTLHNPNSAHHPNGQWDLGDVNSIFVDALDFEVRSPHSDVQVCIHEHCYTNIHRIEQLGSGRSESRSRAHLMHTAEVAPTESYTFINDQISIYRNVQPYIRHQNRHYVLTDFWQRFPSTFTSGDDGFVLSGVNAKLADYCELQPGEKWSRALQISAESTQVHSCAEIPKLICTLCPEYVYLCQAIERITPSMLTNKWHEITRSVISTHNGFSAKQDHIDLYGFRHYGDLFADHESAYLVPDSAPLISVYNNQYDPLFGLLKQYVMSGDVRYFELANALAKHVINVDIYHTQADKPEYNGGLFWHTDHYVDAETSSHRTYSSRQQSGVYDGHAGGGGPGGQHCYTTGLAYYYLLTGNEDAKEAVTSLYQWVTRYYEGDETLYHRLLAWKNRDVPGLKDVKTGRYPLDRGTANYLNAILDMHLLTQSEQYLHHGLWVALHTVSLEDSLDELGLDNIEENWFYTVWLQAVTRLIERLTDQPKFATARANLFTLVGRFAKWMCAHESPYLTRANELEYPNQTWSAQDMRKVDVLMFAAIQASSKQDKQDYLAKALEIEQYIHQALMNSDERFFTRIQALVMQNQMEWESAQYLYTECGKTTHSEHALGATQPDTTVDIAPEDISPYRLKRKHPWSIQKELKQLKLRHKLLSKWI